MVEGLSTNAGFSCRIDTTRYVVVWTAVANGPAANICYLTGLETI